MKSLASKKHFYPFTFRTAAMVNNSWCQDKAFMYLVPPKDALSIENLYCHFKLTFDAGIPSGDRILEYIGICNEIPISPSIEPSYLRKIDINQAANASREVEIRIDLSSLLKKDNARYREYFETPVTADFTYVIIKLSGNVRGIVTVGTTNIWKLDGLFTTKAIR